MQFFKDREIVCNVNHLKWLRTTNLEWNFNIWLTLYIISLYNSESDIVEWLELHPEPTPLECDEPSLVKICLNEFPDRMGIHNQPLYGETKEWVNKWLICYLID